TYVAKLLSILVTALLLAFLYVTIPNTEVEFKAAYFGGLFCAVLWIPLTMVFTKIFSLSTNYSVIYSSFAGIIIALIWLHILWLLFLSGSLVTYFIQSPTLLKPHSTRILNPAEAEHYAKLIINIIVKRFKQGGGITKLSELMEKSHLTNRQVSQTLYPFLEKGVIIETAPNSNRYLLATDNNLLNEHFILETVRGNVHPLQ
ncbi:MAG: YhjD/YihY/BrkB family envelope integrity protein, partial [Ostreibacterium sp.]